MTTQRRFNKKHRAVQLESYRGLRIIIFRLQLSCLLTKPQVVLKVSIIFHSELLQREKSTFALCENLRYKA